MLLTSSVCPQGGFHEFEPVKGEADFWAGLGAGVCSASLCCLWWPLLLWCAHPAAAAGRAGAYLPARAPRARFRHPNLCGTLGWVTAVVGATSSLTPTRSAPACYFGGKEIGKDFANKKCEKCGLEVDRRGQMQKAPNAVPATNPSSGQPNAFYGCAFRGCRSGRLGRWLRAAERGGREERASERR